MDNRLELPLIRLYKNGYAAAYHSWQFDELLDESRLFEFYVLLRPEGVLDRGQRPFALRVFEDTIAAGRDLTEGFYSLYKAVQQDLIAELSQQAASENLTPLDLYGKVHKLLYRVLFIAFWSSTPRIFCRAAPCERQLTERGAERAKAVTGKSSWILSCTLNDGGGIEGIAYNAFNGGLSAGFTTTASSSQTRCSRSDLRREGPAPKPGDRGCFRI